MKSHKLLMITTIIGALCVTNVARAVTLKIASVAPEGSFWISMMKNGARQIKEQTNGRVKFKFYPGGVMGSQDTVLKKMRIRQLHGGAFTSGALGQLAPDSQIYSFPLLFESLHEVDYVRQKMDPVIIDSLADAGLVILGISEGGMVYPMSRQPIAAVSDLQKRKIWSPENNKNVALTFEAFALSPIPLTIADVLLSLQTNLIDTVATSPSAAIALQWHTQIKYVTDIPFLYFYTALAIDKKAFDKIAIEDQRIVRDIMSRTIKHIEAKNRQDNIAALEAMKKQGIDLLKPTENELEQWYANSSKAKTLILNKGKISAPLVEQMMSYITDYRTQQAGM